MSTRLRVAAIQLRSGLEPAKNREQATPFLRQAAADGAQFIATPENTMRLDRDSARLIAAAENQDNEAELRAWGGLAREFGIWLLLGSAAIATGAGKVFNRSLVFDPDGRIVAHYDKIHLFDVVLSEGEAYRESASVEPGRQAVLFDGPARVKVGLSICYDLRFPQLYRRLAQLGAELITVPSAFTRPTGEAHWEVLLRARAIENGAFILAPAQGGRHEDGRSTWGRSMIVDPWGKVLARLDDDEPGYIIADLNFESARQARQKIPAWSAAPAFESQ